MNKTVVLEPDYVSYRHPVRVIMVEQIGAKNNHNTAFYDEDLKLHTITEEAMKSKTGYRSKYYRS